MRYQLAHVHVPHRAHVFPPAHVAQHAALAEVRAGRERGEREGVRFIEHLHCPGGEDEHVPRDLAALVDDLPGRVRHRAQPRAELGDEHVRVDAVVDVEQRRLLDHRLVRVEHDFFPEPIRHVVQ